MKKSENYEIFTKQSLFNLFFGSIVHSQKPFKSKFFISIQILWICEKNSVGI